MIGRTKVISSTITGMLMLTLVVRAQETRGTPGVDYPDYYSIPKTSFSCSGQKYFPGFYADLETKCQVFHLCLKDRQESFLCPTGTTYNQAKLTCDSWYSSNCSLAPLFYNVNSGPVMESASQNIPMLIKLKNRSQRRSFGPPTANVYEKITSLYEGTADEARSSTETSNIAEDVNVESDPEINGEVGSDEVPEETRGASENEWQLNEDLLSRMNAGFQTDGESQGGVYYEDALGQEAEENMEQIFYDPVTEQYYVDYNTRNEWQQDPEDYNFRNVYNYDGLVNKYIALDDFDERFRNSENKVSTDSVDYPDEFKEMLGTVETDEKLLGRMMETEQPVKRLRRKPLYTTVPREDEIGISSVGVKYPVVNTDETESVQMGSETSSELLEEFVTESAEMEDQADTDAPFEIADELRFPNFTPLNASEVPLTAEEFGERIITELVLPRIEELDLRLISSHPTDEHGGEESSASDSQDIQSDDQYSFVEKLTPDDYESYSTDYNTDDTVIVERSDQDIPDEEKANMYRSGEGYSVENEVGAEDTFVVIPDESEGDDSEQSSETDEQVSPMDDSSYYSIENDEQSQNDVAYSYDALRDYFLSRYASTAAHASVDPYRFQTPEFYFPNEYDGQRSYMQKGLLNTGSRELLQSPYPYVDHSGATSDQQVQTGSVYENSPARYYPFVESSSYVYEQPASFADYTYGAENPYSYGEVNGYYDNSYAKDNMNFGYETSDTLDETPDLDFKVNPGYSEHRIPSWIQSDSTENSETRNEQLGIADSSNPTEDYLADSFDASESGSESFEETLVPEESVKEVSLEDENMKQDEIYYLLDFDEDSQETVQPEGDAEISELDDEQLDSKGFSPREKPWQLDKPSEVSGINVASKSESSETAEETIIAVEDSDSKNINVKSPDVSESAANTRSREGTDSWLFQSTESSQVNEKPVTLSSVLEQLSGLNTVKTSRGSDSTSINLSRNKFNAIPFEESELGPSGVANRGQQYRVTDASTLLSTDNVLSYRTGNFQQPSASKLSAIQERIRSLKQGKFGAFKKYINSPGSKE